MVQATKEQVITVTLKLNKHEADWLKGLMQNPLTPNHDPAEEDEYNRAMRLSFWNALGGDVVPSPTPADFYPPEPDGTPKTCTCPPKKNDGSPFDGISYYCPLHGR